MGKKISIHLHNDTPVSPMPVVVRGDTKIPPRSEVIILGTVEGAPPGKIVESRRGDAESGHSPCQQRADQPIRQQSSSVAVERQHHTEGQSDPLREGDGQFPHGLAEPLERQSEPALEDDLGLTPECVDNSRGAVQKAMVPPAETVRPARQRKLPAWTKDYCLDSRASLF